MRHGGSASASGMDAGEEFYLGGVNTIGQEGDIQEKGVQQARDRIKTSRGDGQDIVSITQDQDIQSMGMPQPLNSNKKPFVALVSKM